jgi:hypothetical protein
VLFLSKKFVSFLKKNPLQGAEGEKKAASSGEIALFLLKWVQ